MGAGAGFPALKLTDEDWSKVEAALQLPIIEGTRKEIVEVTSEYVSSAVSFGNSLKLKEVIDQLCEIKAASQAFHKVIVGAHVHPRHLIALFANKPGGRRIGTTEELRDVALAARTIARACTAALGSLDGTPPGPNPRDAWKLWIRDLTDVLEKGRLPTEVRKDPSTPENASPFARFVKALQECLPAEFHKLIQSPEAFARLIVGARSGRKSSSAASE
jgi:hypothetical protein